MILMGYLAAIIWSLISGFVLIHRGNPVEQFDVTVRLFDGANQTTGLLGGYAAMWIFSGVLWVRGEKNTESEQAVDGNPH
jgi:hypothetical protein